VREKVAGETMSSRLQSVSCLGRGVRCYPKPAPQYKSSLGDV
jgi:hypothetical protein